MWDILCDTCEEILSFLSNTDKDVLNSLNGYPCWHSPGLRRRSCRLPSVGVTLRHFTSKKAKPIPDGLGSCGENSRGSWKDWMLGVIPGLWQINQNLILSCRFTCSSWDQILSAFLLSFPFKREICFINGEESTLKYPLIKFNLQITGTSHPRTIHSNPREGPEEGELTALHPAKIQAHKKTCGTTSEALPLSSSPALDKELGSDTLAPLSHPAHCHFCNLKKSGALRSSC